MLRGSHVVCALLSAFLGGCGEPPPAGFTRIVPGNPMADGGSVPPSRVSAEAISEAQLVRDWPRLRLGSETRAITSFDRSGGNDDGFGGTHSVLYIDAAGEHVIFDAFGPGRLTTLWFTSAIDGNGPLELGQVRFYFDDEATPRIALDANALFRGDTAPFEAPLVAANQKSTGGFVSWVPLPYARRLRITTEHRAGFYAAHYETLLPDASVTSWRAGERDEELLRLFREAEAMEGQDAPFTPIPSGGAIEGAGTIDALRFIPDGSPSREQLQSARIIVTFDDAASPHVAAPLDAFFGSGLGEAAVRSVAFTMNPGEYTSRFPMPFWRRASVRVEGIAGKLFARVGPKRYEMAEAGYFEAHANRSHPTIAGSDHVYAEVEGAGKLVGTVLTVEPPAPSAKQWWEGDLRSHVDGLRSPNVHGTGHEDDHFGGWSNEFLSRNFTLPMHGCPKTEIQDWVGQYNGNATMYRLWPGIPFASAIRHSVEHGPENARVSNYSSVAFLYRQPHARVARTDVLDLGSEASRTAHAYAAADLAAGTSLNGAFEGRFAEVATAVVLRHRSPISFSLATTAGNAGVKIRRMYDARTGRQRARVAVAGTFVGTWYVAEANGARPWAERDFVVPPSVTRDRTTLEVTLTPEGDESWSAARYEAWTITP